jgi:hypothetical protein
MLRETALGEVDVADEEGGERNLLAVRLLLGSGNRPAKIPTHQCADALLLLQSLCAGHCHLRRKGGGGELKQYQQWAQRFPISLPPGPQTQLDAEYKELQQDAVRPP